MADDLRSRRATRLAGPQYAKPNAFERKRQHGSLGRLPGTLAAFKRDELASHSP